MDEYCKQCNELTDEQELEEYEGLCEPCQFEIWREEQRQFEREHAAGRL